MSQENSNFSRWWEFYVVRYGMGSVIGGIIVFFLFSSNSYLQPMLFTAWGKFPYRKIDGALLTLLAGYGLAYCYFASAPILVLHAGRFVFQTGDKNKTLKLLWGVIIFIVLNVFWYSLSRIFDQKIDEYWWVAFMLLDFLLTCQICILYAIILNRKNLFHFYKKLANQRAHSDKGGLVESYRHLREHGNSFLILLLEIVLALILYFVSISNAFNKNQLLVLLYYVAIVILWIAPSIFIWFTAVELEIEFVGDNANEHESGNTGS